MGDLQDSNKELVQRYWHTLAERDWEGLKVFLSEDAHYTDVGIDAVGATGPDAVVARLQIGLEPLEAYDHIPGINMIAEGDLVMTEHTERWSFHTGEVIDHSFVSVTEVRDGKICRWHDYSHLGNIIDNAPAWWLERVANASVAAAAAASEQEQA